MSEKEEVQVESAPVVEETEKKPDPDTAPAEESWDPEKALAKIRKSNAEAQKLRERAKSAEESKADAETRLAAERERAQAAERRYVAAKFGLPEALATRLQGSTVDELAEDAQQLLEAVQVPRRTPGVKVTSAPDQSALSDADIDGFVIGAM